MQVAGRGVRDDGERRRGGRDRDEPALLQRGAEHHRGGHLPDRRRQPRVHAPDGPRPLPAPRAGACSAARRRPPAATTRTMTAMMPPPQTTNTEITCS